MKDDRDRFPSYLLEALSLVELSIKKNNENE